MTTMPQLFSEDGAMTLEQIPDKRDYLLVLLTLGRCPKGARLVECPLRNVRELVLRGEDSEERVNKLPATFVMDCLRTHLNCMAA